MGMKKTHDAVYAGEKYTDREGNEKTRYINVGSLFTRDDGSQCMKLESVPIGFTGWINFYEPKEKGEQGQRQERARPARTTAQPSTGAGGFEDDDIPF